MDFHYSTEHYYDVLETYFPILQAALLCNIKFQINLLCFELKKKLKSTDADSFIFPPQSKTLFLHLCLFPPLYFLFKRSGSLCLSSLKFLLQGCFNFSNTYLYPLLLKFDFYSHYPIKTFSKITNVLCVVRLNEFLFCLYHLLCIHH